MVDDVDLKLGRREQVWATLAKNSPFPELLAMNELESGLWNCGNAAVSATCGSTVGHSALSELGLKMR
ncbi:MAG: hypothetical protein JO262_19695 [Solirubrobacterales bacterium]|nr:hypothetical protein [Solirubrobacterales bacterium]MBV9944363.1 hypothetical protein [Solirubrobacterales bacterium]